MLFGSDNEANFQASLKFSWRAKDYTEESKVWLVHPNLSPDVYVFFLEVGFRSFFFLPKWSMNLQFDRPKARFRRRSTHVPNLTEFGSTLERHWRDI